MKVVVAIPVYDGKLPVETVRCLIQEQSVANLSGDDILFQFLPSCSHPAMGRNQLAQQFLDSDADRLVFLDSDVTFETGSLLKIARHKDEFVGGAYRFKFEQENYPVGWLDKPDLWSDENGLLEVASLPGGFLSLSRKVFEKLKEAHPDREYEHFGKKAHCFFQMPFVGGNLYGEDSFFCKEWREIGGQVFLDPELNLTHWDFNRPFVGHIGKWLKNRSMELNKEPADDSK
jgi:hypothetical protein